MMTQDFECEHQIIFEEDKSACSQEDHNLTAVAAAAAVTQTIESTNDKLVSCLCHRVGDEQQVLLSNKTSDNLIANLSFASQTQTQIKSHSHSHSHPQQKPHTQIRSHQSALVKHTTCYSSRSCTSSNTSNATMSSSSSLSSAASLVAFESSRRARHKQFARSLALHKAVHDYDYATHGRAGNSGFDFSSGPSSSSCCQKWRLVAMLCVLVPTLVAIVGK